MELTGRLSDVKRDYITKKPILTFLVNEEPNGIEDLSEKNLKIRINKVTKPRSLDANAYFHVLCDKLRLKLGVSMACMKNKLITDYGQIDYLDDGQAIIYKTNAPVEYIQELEEVHMKFLKVGEDGANWYRLYRGSHTYDSSEMHLLLEGTIGDAIEMGIEVRTPDEIRRMEMLWEERRSYDTGKKNT